MRGGWYWYRGRPRVWYPWKEVKGGKLFFTKYLDGSRIYSPEQAERVLSTIRGQIDAKVFDPANWGKDKTLIFQNAWEVYQKQSPCGKTRYEDRERVKRDHLMPYFEDKSLPEIEEHHIKDWVSKLPDHYSPGSLKNIVNILRAFLNYFQVTRRKVFRYPKISIPKKVVLSLSQEDQERVFEFIPGWHRPIFEFLRRYGCRSGEACNLKKTDIDWSKRTILFRERKNSVENELPVLGEIEKYLVGDGKSRNASSSTSLSRPLRMSAGGVETLQNRNGSPTKVLNIHYVFSTSKGQPYTHQFLYNIWHYANVKAHQKYGVKILPLKNATRHSFVKQKLDEGWSFEMIARWLGNTPQVVYAFYGQISIGKLREMSSTQKVIGILEIK